MLGAVEERRLDAVVTWHNDRLHRSPRELAAFLDLVERSGVRVAVGQRRRLRPHDAGGAVHGPHRRGSGSQGVGGPAAGSGGKHLELAEQGRPASQLGSGVRSEAERELVREAAGRVLAGQGLMTIARDWNRRGAPGTTASPWTAPTLRKVLLSARIAGLREARIGARSWALTHVVWEGAVDRRT
jgi:hypothetical protein